MKIDNIKNNLWQFCRATMVVAVLFIAANCTEEEPADTLYAPTLENQGATNLARTSVTLSGRITGNTHAITEYGFKCSTSEAFPSDQTTKVVVDSPVSNSTFSAEITNLNPNQHYYYCLYATTGSSTIQADAGEFTTISTATPTFGELTIDSIGENVMRLKCSVNEIGDNYLIEYGVSYKTEASTTFIPIAAESFTNSSTREYMVTITGLQAETTYIVRPYAKNSSTSTGNDGVLEGYGEQQLITTEALLSPEVSTKEIGNPGINAITISGVVTAATGSNGIIDECGFCWSSTNTEPTILDDTIRVDVKELNTTFTATIENLKAKTRYYVRAYSKNTVNGVERYGYGEVRTFETSYLVTPQLTIDETTKSATTITATASISNYDANAIIEKGFIWSKSNAQVEIGDADADTLRISAGENIFNGTIEGLEINTRYYLRAYAIYEASGTQQPGYSTYQSITTQSFNTASLDIQVTDITYNSAKIQGSITDWGNAEIIEKGVCWTEGGITPTIENGNKQVIDNDDFSTTLTGLTYDTQYRVRVYAICQIGETQQVTYSGTTHITTTTPQRADIEFETDWSKGTAFTTYFTAKITAQGELETTEVGICWRRVIDGYWNWPVYDDCDGKIALTLNEDGTYSGTIPTLPGQNYMYRVYSKMQIDGIDVLHEYGGRSANSRDLTVEEFHSEATGSSISFSAIVKELEYATDLQEVGFAWIEKADNIDWNNAHKTKCEVGEDGSISTTINDLPSGITYYVRPYVTLKEGLFLDDNQWNVTTRRAPQEEDNSSPDKIEQ